MEIEQRINKITEYLMLGTAAFYDVVEIALDLVGIGIIADTIISFFAGFHFWWWFKIRGVDISLGTRFTKTGAAALLVELIPFLNFLPVTTWGVWKIITMVQLEDAERAEQAAHEEEEEMQQGRIRLQQNTSNGEPYQQQIKEVPNDNNFSQAT